MGLLHGVYLLLAGGETEWPAALDTAAGGLLARYDFANSDSLTLVGPAISNVDDLSGNGNDLVSGSGSRAAFEENVIGSLGGADFSYSISSQMSSAALNLTGSFTYGFVVSGGTDLLGLFDGSFATTLGMRFFGSNAVDFVVGTLSGSFSGSSGGTNIIVTVEDQGATLAGEAFKSGVSALSTSTASASTPILKNIVLGTINGGASGDYSDYVHEVAIWEGVLDSTERAVWDSYVRDKWFL